MSRESLFIIGIAIIFLVLLDGLRRMYLARRSEVTLSPELKKARRSPSITEEDETKTDYFNPELPTGKARVIELDEAMEPTLAPEAEDLLELTMVESAAELATNVHKLKPSKKTAKPKSNTNQSKAVAEMPFPDVIVINVFALDKGKGLKGKELMRFMQKIPLHYGKMDIFHYHAEETVDSDIWFSMANALKPGTFQLEHLHEFVTQGVSFFLDLTMVKQRMAAFDKMLEVTRQLASESGAELKDQHRNPLTAQTVEHYRQCIREFERRHRTHEIKAYS